MNILLTGSAGFIGSHVLDLLVAHGHRVTTLDALDERVHGPTYAGDFYPKRVRRAGEVGYVDILGVDAVIHLAAQVGVADSMADPMRYLDGNTRDTMALLQTIGSVHSHDGGPTKLIVASSMSVYGDPQLPVGEGVTEDHVINPASVYGLSKYDQERLFLMFGDLWGLSTVALRFFNVYGPRQALSNPYTGVLANFANQLLHGEPPTVYEDGQQTRDFVYVEDVAAAVVKALDMPSDVYNVCTGVPTTIQGIAETLAAALGVPIAPDITGDVRPGDIRHCIGDPTRARDEGLVCPTSFTDGMERYAQWLMHQPSPSAS